MSQNSGMASEWYHPFMQLGKYVVLKYNRKKSVELGWRFRSLSTYVFFFCHGLGIRTRI